mgnify:FL=1
MLKALFDKYYTPLCKTIFRIVNDKEAARDLVQEAFIKLWLKRDSLDQNNSIKSYLYRIAINNAFNHLEKHKRIVPLADGEVVLQHLAANQTQELLDADEMAEQITRALELLPPKCKTVFVLSRYEEMSYKEIAENLDISVKTVENQISKALDILRNSLKAFLMLILVFLKNI